MTTEPDNTRKPRAPTRRALLGAAVAAPLLAAAGAVTVRADPDAKAWAGIRDRVEAVYPGGGHVADIARAHGLNPHKRASIWLWSHDEPEHNFPRVTFTEGPHGAGGMWVAAPSGCRRLA